MNRADTALNHATASLLYRLADAVQANQVQRWQITAAAPLLTTLARLLKPTSVQQQRQAMKDTATLTGPISVPVVMVPPDKMK